jgi:hypothetical protein
MSKTPGYALAVVPMLGAGIGATTAMFSYPTPGEHNTPLESIGGSFNPVAFGVDDIRRTSVFSRHERRDGPGMTGMTLTNLLMNVRDFPVPRRHIGAKLEI